MSNQTALGILFQLEGGGDINGATGKRINGQLRQLIGQINRSDTVKLKLKIDTQFVTSQISDIAKKTSDALNKVVNNNGGKKSSGGKSKLSEDYRNASAELKKYYSLLSQVEKASTRTKITKGADGLWTNESGNDSWDELVKQVNAAKLSVDEYTQGEKRANLTKEEQIKLSAQAANAEAKQAIANKNNVRSAQASWDGLSAKVSEYIARVKDAASRDPVAREMLEDLDELAQSVSTEGSPNYQQWDELNSKFREAQHYINQNHLATETWWQSLKKVAGTRIKSMLSGIVLAKVAQGLREVVTNVIEYDTAMTNLKIVTEASDGALAKFSENLRKDARTIGASLSELTKSTETFARLGYDLNSSETLAVLANQYAKVADTDADSATTAITSIVKAFKINADELEGVLDKLMWVGKSYPISAAEIGEGMQNAGSALKAAGNSLDESIAILTAANSSVQDISRAATAVRTITARMTNSKLVLDELGEEGIAISELTEFMGAYGVAVTKSNGELRTTYEILTDLSKVWGTLNNTQQSTIAEKLAGTRQQNIFYSLMNNFDSAQEIIARMDESSGALSKATEKRLDSIQGKLDQFKERWQEFSQDILSSEFVKNLLDIGMGLMTVLNTVAKIVDTLGGLKTVLIAVSGIVLTMKIDSTVKSLKGVWEILKNLKKLGPTFREARAAGMSAGESVAMAFTEAGVAISAAQVAVSVFTIALTALVAIVSAVRRAQEEAISASQSAAEEALTNANSIKELIKRYKELADIKEKSGVWNAEEIEEVRTIQEKIVQATHDQAEAIDLVNGKLDEEIVKLNAINESEAKNALAKAENAITTSVSRFSMKSEYDVGGWAEIAAVMTKYGVQRAGHTSEMSSGSAWYDAFDSTYAIADKDLSWDLEDFLAQYEAVQNASDYLVDSGLYKEYDKAFNSLNKYLNDYKSLYETYIKAKTEYDKILSGGTATSGGGSGGSGSGSGKDAPTITDPSVIVTINKLKDGFYGISDALSDMTEKGKLSAETLSDLYDLEKEGKLNGLQLEEILHRTANGYEVDSDALQKYIDKVLAEAQGESAEQVREYWAVLQSLAVKYAEETAEAASDAQKEVLEKQKEELQKQLDGYKELIDKRKELLNTYKEELDYQKSLSEKQNNVAKLQQQLALARMDDSAAGRSRARDLSQQLSEAQGDLNEFTLDHAVDILINDLDDQYNEYKTMIDTKLDGIEISIKSLEQATSDAGSDAATTIGQIINSAMNKDTQPRAYYGNIPSYITQDGAILPHPHYSGITPPAAQSNFNAPLVEIKADTITEQSLPILEECVNKAVERVEQILTGGMSRVGRANVVK